MGFQSAFNRAFGSVAGGIMGVSHTLEKRNELIQRQQQAQQKAEQTKAAKQQQVQKRRNFMEYLAKQETSLGGTVGELPVSMQKEIAKTYTKSQRRTMMDRMDREAKDGNK